MESLLPGCPASHHEPDAEDQCRDDFTEESTRRLSEGYAVAIVTSHDQSNSELAYGRTKWRGLHPSEVCPRQKDVEDDDGHRWIDVQDVQCHVDVDWGL